MSQSPKVCPDVFAEAMREAGGVERCAVDEGRLQQVARAAAQVEQGIQDGQAAEALRRHMREIDLLEIRHALQSGLDVVDHAFNSAFEGS